MRKRYTRYVLAAMGFAAVVAVAAVLWPGRIHVESTGVEHTEPSTATLVALSVVGNALESLPATERASAADMDPKRLAAKLYPLLQERDRRYRHPLHYDACHQVLDGWGAPVRFKIVGRYLWPYSIGPNGVDEDGKGDDVGIPPWLPGEAPAGPRRPGSKAMGPRHEN